MMRTRNIRLVIRFLKVTSRRGVLLCFIIILVVWLFCCLAVVCIQKDNNTNALLAKLIKIIKNTLKFPKKTYEIWIIRTFRLILQ